MFVESLSNLSRASAIWQQSLEATNYCRILTILTIAGFLQSVTFSSVSLYRLQQGVDKIVIVSAESLPGHCGGPHSKADLHQVGRLLPSRVFSWCATGKHAENMSVHQAAEVLGHIALQMWHFVLMVLSISCTSTGTWYKFESKEFVCSIKMIQMHFFIQTILIW